MSERRGRNVSRRGLFGVFGRGFQSLRDGLGDVQDAATGRPRDASRPVVPRPAPASYPRILRGADRTVTAQPAGAGSWTIDLRGRTLEPGDSLAVTGGGMPEPMVLVRVHRMHWAACTGQCSVDGSDLVWHRAADRLRCPACQSSWRLDGEVLEGPADCPIGRFVVDAFEAEGGGFEVRVHAL